MCTLPFYTTLTWATPAWPLCIVRCCLGPPECTQLKLLYECRQVTSVCPISLWLALPSASAFAAKGRLATSSRSAQPRRKSVPSLDRQP